MRTTATKNAAAIAAMAVMLSVTVAQGAEGRTVLRPVTGKAGCAMPIAITDLHGDATVASIIRSDLSKHGSFCEARVTPSDMRKLDEAERARGTIMYPNWRNLGATYMGKGTVQGTTAEFSLYNINTTSRMFSKQYTVTSPRRLAHEIADDIIKAALGEKGIFSGKLLYVKTVGPNKNICMCDADGSNPQMMTRLSNLCIFPDWFPDGQNAVFTGYMEGRPILYKLDLRSKVASKLLALPGMNTSGTISPDGTKLAAILDKDGLPELYSIDLQSKHRVRLTRDRAAESSPTWAPDSRRLAYSSEVGMGSPQIFVITASGGSPQRITSGFSRYCTSPTWSPDGKKIAFVAQFGSNFDICMYDFATRQCTNLTNDPSNDEAPSWARDSRHIAFSRGSYSGTRIMLLDSESGKTSVLVNDSSSSQPAFQP